MEEAALLQTTGRLHDHLVQVKKGGQHPLHMYDHMLNLSAYTLSPAQLLEPYLFKAFSSFFLNIVYFFPVSVSDVEVIREGHQSEVLLSIAEEFPADRCFTLVFRSRRGNLDLVAESADEAQSWIRGIRKLVENLENMGEREKLDQYLLLCLPLPLRCNRPRHQVGDPDAS